LIIIDIEIYGNCSSRDIFISFRSQETSYKRILIILFGEGLMQQATFH